MALDQIKENLQEIKGIVEKLKSEESSDDWGLLLGLFDKINVLSKENDWTSMLDAALAAEALVQQALIGASTDVSQSLELLDSINSAIETLVNDIEQNGHITKSIKGVIAEIKLFLGDFDYISTDESSDNQEANADEIDIFDEFKKRVTTIENLVMDLDETDYDDESINTIFREYHTLKGEAGFTGCPVLSEFCHKIESTIDPLRKKKIRLTKEITDLLLYFSDTCKSYIENAQNLAPLPSEQEIDENISTLQNLIAESGEISAEPDSESAKDAEPEPESDMSEFAGSFPLDDEEEAQLEEKVEASPAAQPDTIEEPPEQTTPEKESPPSRSSKSSSLPSRRADERRKLDSGMNMQKIDALMEIAGELTILYQTISQSEEMKSYASDGLTKDLDAMGRLFKDLQMITMSIRMTSITPLFQRLNRIIRDSSRDEKKSIEVKMIGATTIIDKNLMEDVAGGLVHIVRNSVGHGIEPPRERIKAGKPEKGTIYLKSFRDANNVVIEVSDDGKGISKDKVLKKAIEKGLVKENEKLSEKEILDLLFLPGFSTAEKVTGLSGRGVGMDVVKTSIEKLRGKIELTSEEGKGSKTRLILPFTFAIIEGLVIKSGKEFFVVPLAQVHEMVSMDPKNIQHMKGEAEFVDIRGKLLPLVRLDRLFSGKDNGGGQSDTPKVVVSIEHDHKMCAILTDEVVAAQEIVLKEMKDSFKKSEYVSAAGILGNRRIGLVLDVGEITDQIYSNINIEKVSSQKLGKRDEDQIEIVEIGTNQVAMIDFFLEWNSGKKKEKLLLAINAFKTKEFLAITETTMLPTAPKGFTGMLTLRGRTIPIFSLGKLLMPYLPEESIDENLIVICEFSKKEVGFLVSGVNKVNYISWNNILPPPNSNELIKIQNIVGTILRDKQVIFILDFEKLVGSVMNLYGALDVADGRLKTRKPQNTILLVEDSTLMRKKMKEALEKVGVKVIEAADGKEGLDTLYKYYHEAKESGGSIFDHIDLILSDIEMPQLDGYTFTKTVKSHPELRVLPVLLHSSLSNETIVRRAKEVRADGFISKCDPEKIYESLEKYL